MSEKALSKVQAAVAAPAGGKTLADLFERQRGEIEKALPAHIATDHFIRVALNAAKDPRSKLHECDATSVLSGLMQAAVLGLEIGDVRGQAYLIPRRQGQRMNAVFQVGYRGYIDLAWRAGLTIDTQVVRAGDRFDFQLGTSPSLVHRPSLQDDQPTEAFYAVAFFPDGRPPIFSVMSLGQMEKHRDRFASRKADDAVWWTDFDAMGRKTMIRQVLGRLPMSVELRDAYEADSVPVLPSRIVDAPVLGDQLPAPEMVEAAPVEVVDAKVAE